MRKGAFIVFEGIDAAGKTTHSKLLVKNLKERFGLKNEVIWLREPTSGYWGQRIKELATKGIRLSARDELEHFMKDRRENVEKNIIPALEKNMIVIQDRYFFSKL